MYQILVLFLLTERNISGLGLLSETGALEVVTIDDPLPPLPTNALFVTLEVLFGVVAFILSSSKQEAMKLKPRKSSCAFALGGTPGESE